MVRIFDKWLAIGLGLLTALLVINIGVAYRNTEELHTNAFWVAHTYEVLDALDNLLSTIKDAETGQRGFLLTGDTRTLRPYVEAVASLDEKINHIKDLTADNDRQRQRILALNEILAAKVAELKDAVALREKQGFDAARHQVLANLDRSRMDAIRTLVEQMRADENELLQIRRNANDRAYKTSLISGTLVAFTGLAGLTGVSWLLRRHLQAQLVAAAALREQREWFRTTLASIGDAVIATDSHGRIAFLNPLAETLTGWAGAEAAGQPLARVFKIINEQSRQSVEDPSSRALREGTIVGLANHTLLIAKDGTERPIEDSAAPIRGADHAIVGVVLVFRDATERRHLEQQLHDRATQLGEADRRKDEFLATLAHELRNPLAPIRNAVELLRRARGNTGLVLQATDLMDRQLSQLVRLVDDLLDVSRITSGKLQLREQPVELATVVQSAVEACRPLIDASAHELRITLPPESVYLRGDSTRLAQILSNLLNNAAKYTDKGGTIWLTARRDGNEAVLSVRDTGIGIAAQNLPHVFERFSQIEPALERSRDGLGIGLSLVRGLAELHGGSVDCHSEGLGMGSEFIVRLPTSKTSLETAPTGENRGAEGRMARRGRILVVDDNRDAADSLALVLRLMGHETLVAHDGLEAVQAAAKAPDVTFLDIGLPKLNGYEVARRIREQPWGRDMVLIALTGWGQEEDKRRALEAGFDHHLTKPVDPASLTSLLATLLPSGQPL